MENCRRLTERGRDKATRQGKALEVLFFDFGLPPLGASQSVLASFLLIPPLLNTVLKNQWYTTLKLVLSAINLVYNRSFLDSSFVSAPSFPHLKHVS
jgi:hypothetical protein